MARKFKTPGVYSIENAVGRLREEKIPFMDHDSVLTEYRKRLRECGYDIERALLDVTDDIIYAQGRTN